MDLDVATQHAGNWSRVRVYKDPYSALCRRLGMISRFRASVRLGAGTILIIAGILFWIFAIVLPLTSIHVGLLASLGHIERQSLPIIAGDASLVAGIMFLLAPRRHRRRRYYDEGEIFSSLAHPSSPTRGHWAFPTTRIPLPLLDGCSDKQCLKELSRINQDSGKVFCRKFAQCSAIVFGSAAEEPMVCIERPET